VADGPVVAVLNRTLFQRAVSNLLANAIAHTPAGGRVAVTVSARTGTLCVDVADTGEGIAPEHLARVSDRFYRVDPSRQSGGLGLGLAIVRSIMTVHGGRLELSSEPAAAAAILRRSLSTGGSALHVAVMCASSSRRNLAAVLNTHGGL
jgi:signal transduction histidine kinase